MINGVFLQSFGFFGGGFGNLLSQLEQLGFFSYVLPFLLIFALVFGIMTRVKIFENNKAINAIIALAVGLMALQFNFVPVFFSEIFPRLGIGLSVILGLLILVGLFSDYSDPDKRGIATLIIWIVGLITFIIIIVQSFGSSVFTYSSFWFYTQQHLGTIITVGALIAGVGWIISLTNPQTESFVDRMYKAAKKI